MTIIEALKKSTVIRRACLDKNVNLMLVNDISSVFINQLELLATDWEPVIEKKMKIVWQWRYFQHKDGDWIIMNRLLTEDQAKSWFGDKRKFEKHAGPFEVEI